MLSHSFFLNSLHNKLFLLPGRACPACKSCATTCGIMPEISPTIWTGTQRWPSSFLLDDKFSIVYDTELLKQCNAVAQCPELDTCVSWTASGG